MPERAAGALVAPAPISFRTATFEGGEVFEARRQPWAKVGFALTGVMEVSVEGKRFLSPPHYATWIPADASHRCHNRDSVKFVTIYIDREWCREMPDAACTLVLSPLIRAIFSDFLSRDVMTPQGDDDLRLAHVLMDQLRKAPRRDSYLPVSDDPLVKSITDALQLNPSDRRSLADWAESFGATERTVSRRFQSCLGISFNEWRQRLRLVVALSQIEAGKPVQRIADDLGYSTPSAFIAMFRRQTGTSPSFIGTEGG
ncbi:AraC family transcriptional regulator [Pandoraea oxalativorans]|uniref:AraC family transcriptional regulator n=1 Tax=Pandoraea oxalativorans TaxID=573737 RepID=A0A0E3YH23_9BURK|nr:helix-turn-helix transcriptional regulator [Pandoraea oxalativorans]AKC72432.2 AraC family transcriptional regulator [Pandoraea oxalativorans]